MHFTRLCLFSLLFVGSCSSNTSKKNDPMLRGLAQPRVVPVSTEGRVLARIDGSDADTASLEAFLRETAGAVVLAEMALDHAVAREFTAAGLTLSAGALDAERLLLLSAVSTDATVDNSSAASLIERFREARGLGPKRYEALLTRSARLRALVRHADMVTPDEVNAGVTAELSAVVLARIIVTPSYAEAAEARDQILAAGPLRSARFTEVAFRASRDPSAPRGGLFGPVSPTDPGLPMLVRDALTRGAGSLSEVLSIDAGFAVVLVESESPARPMPSGTALEQLRSKVRLRKEREAMDRVAARLQSETKVTPLDDSLRWSWDHRPGR